MSELRRELGLVPMIALSISMMLGSGIFFGPTFTAAEFPDATVVLLLWAAGGAIAFLGAWVFGRLATRYPLSGGPYAYLRASFGPYTAFLYAWTSFVIIAPTSMAVMTTLLAKSVGVIVPLSPVGVKIVATGAIAAFAFVNLASVRLGGAAQSALSTLKVALVLGLVVALAFVASRGPAPPAPAPAGLGRWSLAFVGILFAYGGWDYAVLASEEIRDAQRNIPRGLLLGVAIVTVLYMATVWGFLQALGPAGVADASAALAPLAIARAGVLGAAAVVAIAIAISAAGTINAVMLLGPRATYAVAREESLALPAWIGRVSDRGVPAAAIALQSAMTIAYVWTGAFDVVTAYTVLGVAVFVVLSSIGLVLIDERRGRSVESYAAILVALIFGWFLAFLLLEAPSVMAVGMALIMSGTLAYAWARRRQQAQARRARNGPG